MFAEGDDVSDGIRTEFESRDGGFKQNAIGGWKYQTRTWLGLEIEEQSDG